MLPPRLFKEAIGALETAVRLGAGPFNGVGRLGYAYGVSGRRSDAKKVLSEMIPSAGSRKASALAIALVYVGLNDHEQALQWLGKGLLERSPHLPLIRIDALFNPLRCDQRFFVISRQMNR